LAGSVLADAGTGPLHKTAHVLGGMFDLDHGAMYAVLLPRLAAHQRTSGAPIDGRLVDCLGSEPDAALADLATELGAPTSLAELGLPTSRIDAAAAAVADHAGLDLDPTRSILTD
jgi:alcohol dehydrogenase class IV